MPSYLYVPQPYLTLFDLWKASGPRHYNSDQGKHFPLSNTHHKLHICLFFKKLVTSRTTENSHHGCISELCIVKFYCQETMFPNFNVYFSQNGYPILYTKFSL